MSQVARKPGESISVPPPPPAQLIRSNPLRIDWLRRGRVRGYSALCSLSLLITLWSSTRNQCSVKKLKILGKKSRVCSCL